ncbi:unnamed protein product, partial [Owenia fusiformis]
RKSHWKQGRRMALVTKPTSTGTSIENVTDITNNLPTLQFESALSEDERLLLPLRARTHAITVTACAQAAYFVSILNEVRQIKAELRHPKQKRAKLLQETIPRDPILVGIIGCGRLGTHLAQMLLTYGEVQPQELKISTRRPETLVELQDKGVKCFHDNVLLASSVHLLFLCVLPAQLPSLAEEIKPHISTRCTIYSFVNTIHTEKLKQLLNFTNIVKPEFTWTEDNCNTAWDYTCSVCASMENADTVRKTCPLTQDKNACPIQTSDKLPELLVYAFINMCTTLRLTRSEIVDLINGVVLGITSHDIKGIVADDITRVAVDSAGLFPKFDLTQVAVKETSLGKKLSQDKEIRHSYITRYCTLFEQYLHWKNFGKTE